MIFEMTLGESLGSKWEFEGLPAPTLAGSLHTYCIHTGNALNLELHTYCIHPSDTVNGYIPTVMRAPVRRVAGFISWSELVTCRHGAMFKSLAQAARLRRRPARPPCCARRRERRRCAQARPHHPAQSTRSPRASCPALHVPDRAPPFADPTAVCLCRATAGLGRAEQAPRAWRRRGAHPLLEV